MASSYRVWNGFRKASSSVENLLFKFKIRVNNDNSAKFQGSAAKKVRHEKIYITDSTHSEYANSWSDSAREAEDW